MVVRILVVTISRFSIFFHYLPNADARQPAVFPILSQVPFSRSSLYHKSVFIMDRPSRIFFSGCNSSTETRAKVLGGVKHLKENRHLGRCDIAAIGRATDS